MSFRVEDENGVIWGECPQEVLESNGISLPHDAAKKCLNFVDLIHI